MRQLLQRIFSIALCVALVGCQTTFEQGEYRAESNRVVLEKIGFRGVSMAVPTGFRVVTDFSVMAPDDPRRIFFEKESAWLNAEEGVRYFYYEPLALVHDVRGVEILITPGILKTYKDTLAMQRREPKMEFVRTLAIEMRFDRSVKGGHSIRQDSTASGRVFALLSNAPTEEPEALEERLVLGNLNEYFFFTGRGPESERAWLSAVLWELIESLDFGERP